MKQTRIALAALLLAGSAQAQTVGLHLGSVHVPRRADQQDFNPGFYFKAEDGLTAGIYRNTIGRTSVYAGYTADAGPFSLTAGLITGYQHHANCITAWIGGPPAKLGQVCGTSRGSQGAVTAFLNPSMRLPIVLGLTPRLTLVPPWCRGDVTTLHLSIERGFR